MDGLPDMCGAEPVLFEQFFRFSALAGGVIYGDELLWSGMPGAEHLSDAFAKSSEALMFRMELLSN